MRFARLAVCATAACLGISAYAEPTAMRKIEAANGNFVIFLAPPVPISPPDGARGLQGACEVRFDVENYTAVLVRDVQCSHAVFCRAARDSLTGADAMVEDSPETGFPGVAEGAVFPIVFLLDQKAEPEVAWDLIPCADEGS